MTVLEPQGLGRTQIHVSIAFLVLTWAVVGMRMAVRINHKTAGLDDYTMIGGLMLFTVVCTTTVVTPYYGVGARDDRLTPELNTEARKWFLMFHLFYVASTVPIKAAICVMLMRITPSRVYQHVMYAIIGFSAVTACITDVALLARCKPIAATWDPSRGQCGSPAVITSLGYFFSASTIITDWSCAVLPVVLVWNLQMKLRMKLWAGAVMGLGFLASAANIVRLQYMLSYQSTENYLHGIAHIALWSVIESGTGIIAGSMPALAPLVPYMTARYEKRYGSSKDSRVHRVSTKPSFQLRPMHHHPSTTCGTNRQSVDETSDTESQHAILDNSITVKNAFVMTEQMYVEKRDSTNSPETG